MMAQMDDAEVVGANGFGLFARFNGFLHLLSCESELLVSLQCPAFRGVLSRLFLGTYLEATGELLVELVSNFDTALEELVLELN